MLLYVRVQTLVSKKFCLTFLSYIFIKDEWRGEFQLGVVDLLYHQMHQHAEKQQLSVAVQAVIPVSYTAIAYTTLNLTKTKSIALIC